MIMRTTGRISSLLLSLLAACESQTDGSSSAYVDAPLTDVAHLGCPPVTTSRVVSTGDVVTSDLRGLTVDNGHVRIRYGAHAMDFRDMGVTRENPERHADHVLAARHTDDPSVNEAEGCVSTACHSGGTHWHDAVYPWYGDGITYSSAAPIGDADRVRVLRVDDDAVELSYEWDNVRLDGLRSPGYCSLGRYPECGPTSRDHEGAAVWLDRATDTVKSVKSLTHLWKTVRVERCTPGYYVSLRSDPPLVWPEQGSRAVRIGYVSTRVAWACDGSAIARHPEAGMHVSLGVTDCIADVPDQAPGHNGWPFIRVMRTYRALPFSSLQYSSDQLGSPGASDIWDELGPDGRAVPWQAFIGATEYVSPGVELEPTAESLGIGQSLGDITWPKK